MKKYFLFILIAIAAVSCSDKKPSQQEKVEKSVSNYVKSSIDDAKSYISESFGKIDSLKIEDTQLYKDTQAEKMRLEENIQILEGKIKSIEETGKKDSEELYSELKDELNREETKLEKIDSTMRDLEIGGRDYIYFVSHKYKAQKDENSQVIVHEEIFYVNKDGNVVRVVYI